MANGLSDNFDLIGLASKPRIEEIEKKYLTVFSRKDDDYGSLGWENNNVGDGDCSDNDNTLLLLIIGSYWASSTSSCKTTNPASELN